MGVFPPVVNKSIHRTIHICFFFLRDEKKKLDTRKKNKANKEKNVCFFLDLEGRNAYIQSTASAADKSNFFGSSSALT